MKKISLAISLFLLLSNFTVFAQEMNKESLKMNEKTQIIKKEILIEKTLQKKYLDALNKFKKDDFSIMVLSYSDIELKEILKKEESILNTDKQSYLMGLIALNKDKKYDMQIKELVNEVKLSQMENGKFSDYTNKDGEDLLNSHIFGIISLYCASFDDYNKVKALSYLLSMQNEDGGFPIFKGDNSNLDMTYMSIIALKMLGKDKNTPCIKKAYNYANKVKNIRPSVESISWEIISKKALDMEVTKDVIKSLEEYKLQDNTYKHLKNLKKSNHMATWHGIFAELSIKKNYSLFDNLKDNSKHLFIKN
ncbi:MAG: terpene cyclase/mutase family protein [Peptostreptococcaceae bacterium]|jgi:prenyltransferase beta subunit|nr:terpene cyclase/mutase family protein [Peptostreptococcaceae bacterium]